MLIGPLIYTALLIRVYLRNIIFKIMTFYCINKSQLKKNKPCKIKENLYSVKNFLICEYFFKQCEIYSHYIRENYNFNY